MNREHDACSLYIPSSSIFLAHSVFLGQQHLLVPQVTALGATVPPRGSTAVAKMSATPDREQADRALAAACCDVSHACDTCQPMRRRAMPASHRWEPV